jgi:acryloyl-coenzyme A reductase
VILKEKKTEMMDWSRIQLVSQGFEEPLICETKSITPPQLGPAQVLIKVDACGVCYRDLVDRSGRFPFMQLPITPGHEVAGTILDAGQDSAWVVGDRVATLHRDHCGECIQCQHGDSSLCTQAAWVFGLMTDGGYASHLVAPDRALYRIPDDIDSTRASIFHCTFGTAWRGLLTIGSLQPKERVLITGANGGVGSAAIQIAKRTGAWVAAQVRDEKHSEYVKRLGADEVVIDSEAQFHKSAISKSIDLILECVGSPTFNASLRCLRMGGRLVVVGNVDDKRAEVNLGYIVVNGIRILCGGAATHKDMDAFLDSYRQNPYAVSIAETLGLPQAEDAQQRLLRGGIQGRMVIVPSCGSAFL